MPSERLEEILKKNPKAKDELQQAKSQAQKEGVSKAQEPNSQDPMKLQKPTTRDPQHQNQQQSSRPLPARGLNAKNPHSVSNPNTKPQAEKQKGSSVVADHEKKTQNAQQSKSQEKTQEKER